MKRLESQGGSSVIIHPVRRLIVSLLLLLLPLQFAFAAAAPYCALERAKVASHFGHHEHPDASAPEPADDDGGKGKPHDCAVCHLGAVQLHPAVASVPASPHSVIADSMPDDRQPQHFQEPTERPPRASLA